MTNGSVGDVVVNNGRGADRQLQVRPADDPGAGGPANRQPDAERSQSAQSADGTPTARSISVGKDCIKPPM